MTIALGAHVSAANGVAGLAITTATRTTAASGSTFSVAVVWFASGGVGAVPTVTDSKGNTYTQVGSALTNGNNRCAIFESVNGTGGTLHTFTATFLANQDVISIWANEITGALTVSPRDQAPGGNDDNASPYTSLTTGTTAQPNEILIAYGFTLSVSGTEVFTWGNSFTGTGDDQTNANADFTGTSGTRVVSAVNTYQASFTSTGAGSTEALVFIVTYKDLVSGASVAIFKQRGNAIQLESAPLDERLQRRPWLPIGSVAVVNNPPLRSRARIADELVQDDPIFKRRSFVQLAPDPPPLVQYDTSDLDPAIYDDIRVRRPWAPVGSVQVTTQPTVDRNLIGFDEAQLEERLAKRAAFPISLDTPIFAQRRSIEERTNEDTLARRPWYPGSTDLAPLTRARTIFDEAGAQDNATRKPWAPPGVAAVVNPAPNAPRRAVSDEAYPDGIQRRPWIPVSGPIPDSAPLKVKRAVTDESAPDLITRRPWIPVSGPVQAQVPGSRARVLADDALPDERQRRPWLPVSGPVAPQQQALARPRGVLDEAIEERLQRRPWAPPSSDAPIWRAGRALDESVTDERLARRQWAPIGTTQDAPPRVSRARVTDELAPDGIQRKPWAPPSGPPVVRDNPPLRAVHMVADERYPDLPQQRPWIPVSGPVIPQFGGSVRVYYRSQSVRVRIIE